MAVNPFGTDVAATAIKTPVRRLFLKGTFPNAKEVSMVTRDHPAIVRMPGLVRTKFANELHKVGRLADDRLFQQDSPIRNRHTNWH